MKKVEQRCLPRSDSDPQATIYPLAGEHAPKREEAQRWTVMRTVVRLARCFAPVSSPIPIPSHSIPPRPLKPALPCGVCVGGSGWPASSPAGGVCVGATSGAPSGTPTSERPQERSRAVETALAVDHVQSADERAGEPLRSDTCDKRRRIRSAHRGRGWRGE